MVGGWGDRDGGRWGSRDGGPPLPTNNRWKEDGPNDRYNGGGYGGRGSGREDRRGGGGGGGSFQAEDWTKPLPRNERLEEELFGAGHGPSGINFDR